jgi:hypothetical protein
MSGQPVAEFFMGHVVLDRTLSQVPLTAGEPAESEGHSFELFDEWISRLGYRTTHGSGDEAFSGDALVILYPSGPVEREFRDRLVRYVSAGGKLLIVDSPSNAGSTANDLLEPFKLSFDDDAVHEGQLVVDREEGPPWPRLTIDPARATGGGEPFAFLGETPVGTMDRHGKGAVTAVGFGSLFGDASLGRALDETASAESLVPYNLQSALLRSLMTDQAFVKTLPRPSQSE